MQYGHYYYAELPVVLEDDTVYKRKPPGGMAGRNINALVQLRDLSTERWRKNNLAVIAQLNESRTPSIRGEILASPIRRPSHCRTRGFVHHV